MSVPTLVVLDTTVLSNFGHIRRPDLILQLWPQTVATTRPALAEYEAGVAAGVLSSGIWSNLEIMELTPDEDALSNLLAAALGPGERSCLSVAIARKGIFASDDRRARAEGGSRGVPVTGTIGILIGCVRLAILTSDKADELLSDMIAFGYRSPVHSLFRFLP